MLKKLCKKTLIWLTIMSISFNLGMSMTYATNGVASSCLMSNVSSKAKNTKIAKSGKRATNVTIKTDKLAMGRRFLDNIKSRRRTIIKDIICHIIADIIG